MTFKTAFIAGVAALSLVMAPTVSLAQEAGAIEVEAEGGQDRRPEDNWLKVCDDVESDRRACIMRQVVLSSGVFTGSFLLRDDPGQESRLLAVAAVPLGVLLPFGLTWQIDGGRPIRVPYMLCDPQSCAAQLVVNEAYVDTLKRGATLRLTAKNRQNEDLVIEINLTGFTAVYDSDEAMTVEQLNQGTSGENVLEQVLQDRAEELRREQAGSEDEAPEEAPAP